MYNTQTSIRKFVFPIVITENLAHRLFIINLYYNIDRNVIREKL